MFYFLILLPLRLGLVSTAPPMAAVGDPNIDTEAFTASEDSDGSLAYIPADDFGSSIIETEKSKPLAPHSDAQGYAHAPYVTQNSNAG